MKKLLLLVLCSGCSVQDEYVAADRATYEVIAPAYQRYVRSDVTLADDQKVRRFRLLSSWLLRISKAER